MNKKEIEELIKFVSKSGVNEVNLETKEIKITIKNSDKNPAPVMVQAAPPVPVTAPPVAAAPVAAPAPTAAEKSAEDESKYLVVKSPMIGTFYRASSPDKPNFANVGDEVSPGKVICIIEAMKLFNEIECDVAGKIVKVLIDNSTPVEYDQPLFLIDPA